MKILKTEKPHMKKKYGFGYRVGWIQEKKKSINLIKSTEIMQTEDEEKKGTC